MQFEEPYLEFESEDVQGLWYFECSRMPDQTHKVNRIKRSGFRCAEHLFSFNGPKRVASDD